MKERPIANYRFGIIILLFANIRWQKVPNGQDWGMERAIQFLNRK